MIRRIAWIVLLSPLLAGVASFGIRPKMATSRGAHDLDINRVQHPRQASSTVSVGMAASASDGDIRVFINDAYDGGNIEYLGCYRVSSANDDDEGIELLIKLNIKPDAFTELEQTRHFQYFSFRSTIVFPATMEPSSCLVTYSIENAGAASYAMAWPDSTVFYSKTLNDPDSWKRKLDTSFVPNPEDVGGGKLTWTHQHQDSSSCYFSYFPPFTYAQHLSLIEKCSKCTRVETLGQSLEGRDIECVVVGSGPKVVWIIHRQHPGEHMAEYFAEGLLTRLLGLNNSNNSVDGLVHSLLKMYTFYVVPSMNPDGGVKGYLRTNAAGANLNREWDDNCYTVRDDNAENTSGMRTVPYEAPTLHRSPEVACVLSKMDQVGECHVFLDVHGDEGLPFNFLAVSVVPNWQGYRQALHGAFAAAYSRANPDMQRAYGYPAMLYNPNRNTLNKATNQMGYRFAHSNCLAMTLEMPFKDCLSNPDPERGWNPARSRQLGASVLDALHYLYPYMQDDEAWKSLPPQDAFVTPSFRYKDSL